MSTAKTMNTIASIVRENFKKLLEEKIDKLILEEALKGRMFLSVDLMEKFESRKPPFDVLNILSKNIILLYRERNYKVKIIEISMNPQKLVLYFWWDNA